MDEIEHQAVGHDAEASFGAVQRQQIEIHAPIRMGEKDSLPVRTALRDMVRGAGYDEAGVAGHQRESHPEPARFSEISGECEKSRSGCPLFVPFRVPLFVLTGALLTNFHLPQSSLLLLVCAFAGTELALSAYRHAVEQRYRFFSYGDCMLIV